MRTAKTMLDRTTALPATAEGTATTTLTRRRALFAVLVAATMAAETSCFEAFAAKWQGTVPVTYRRRAVNTAFKSGNIREFCDRWGNNHEFAITLDADSFMPADAVLRLLRIAQANPTLGIL